VTLIIPVVTIDGPAGAGKGTIGQHTALALDWNYLDSGALYRIAALVAEKHGLSIEQSEALVELLRDVDIRTEARADSEARIQIEGDDVSERLRTPEIGKIASRLAKLPEIREALLWRQKIARRSPGLVADGRDMGTVVFPDAVVKIFLTASPEERAQRRHKQLKDKGLDVNLARLLEEMRQRDQRDRERSESPLKAADDALILDTTDLSIGQVVERVLELVSVRLS